MPIQKDLFGNEVVVGDIYEKLAHILRRHGDARDSYKAALFWYWVEFDGLESVLDTESLDKLRRFMMRATSPKTLQNRCSELQHSRPELDARPDVRAWRERQARAGRVG